MYDVGKCQHVSEICLSEASLGANVFQATLSSPVVSRMKKNGALIDFAGPHRKVYQVTVSANHKMSLNGLSELFLASGHLVEQNGMLVESETAGTIGNISYYWVVPEAREYVWKHRAPISVTKRGLADDCQLKYEVVSACLLKYVTQYALVMDKEPREL